VAGFDSERPWLTPGTANAWPQPSVRGGDGMAAGWRGAQHRGDARQWPSSSVLHAGVPGSAVPEGEVGMAAGAPEAPASPCHPWCCWGGGLAAGRAGAGGEAE